MFYSYPTTVTNNINQKTVINREIVHYVYSYLYLGIDIDEHLTFDTFLLYFKVFLINDIY